MNQGTIFLLIVLGILVISIISMYNKLVSAHQKVKRSKSNIDVFLKKRFDLIPNLQNIVKGYMEHEKAVLEEITQLRTSYEKNKDINTANELNEKLSSFLAIAESYPELKSNELFLNFQKELSNIEDELQAVRRIYNNSVTKFNTLIGQIPYNIFNIVLKYQEAELLKFDTEQVDVKF